ncbi:MULTISPECIES: hypothetical protein [unclassified Pedobacter]|nr:MULTISPECIES: hypothetical protein [unclassified Pedobacter]MCX2433458.1 hypothetical protein [Pedobacter sp. GR22-10]MCX2585168.1 hypothetical protein [Pedobacter sp. MR22-3]
MALNINDLLVIGKAILLFSDNKTCRIWFVLTLQGTNTQER